MGKEIDAMSKGRVLVVDDEADVRKSVHLILSKGSEFPQAGEENKATTASSSEHGEWSRAEPGTPMALLLPAMSREQSLFTTS